MADSGQIEFDFSVRAGPVPGPVPSCTGMEELARDLLRGIGCRGLAERVRVRWDSRLRSTAGRACYRTSTVTINLRLREFGEREVDTTLRHELAHLLARERAGRRVEPHGPEWRQACADLGIPGERRCHSLPLPRSQFQRRHLYRCSACGVEVRRVRPFYRPIACLECCRKHNSGRFDDRFRLVKIALDRETKESEENRKEG